MKYFTNLTAAFVAFGVYSTMSRGATEAFIDAFPLIGISISWYFIFPICVTGWSAFIGYLTYCHFNYKK